METQSAERIIGRGQRVFERPDRIEGPVYWLEDPEAVLKWISSGLSTESIALSRGGTMSFMAPVLSTGVRGLLTLQGAPESHLGILAREYGIPCIMSVKFDEGIKTSRGETIPADGTVLSLDLSSDGLVLVREES